MHRTTTSLIIFAFAALTALANSARGASMGSSLSSQGLPERRPNAQSNPAGPMQKSQILERLKSLQNRQVVQINALEDSLKKQLAESTSISLKGDLTVADRKISLLADNVTDLQRRRDELLARRELVDALILLVDSKWNGQPLKAFLEHSVLDLAIADLTNPQGGSSHWRFLTFLSIAVREIPEPREDVLGVLESYLQFATVTNPKTPAEFLNNRHYSNSMTSVTAAPVDRSRLGEHLERRQREIGHKDPRLALPVPTSSGAETGAIELRLRAPMSPDRENTPDESQKSTAPDYEGAKDQPPADFKAVN